MQKDKPLGHKAYGHIPHFEGSRIGPGDHKISEGQATIATRKKRDKHDLIIVQEKVDGSCVSVAKIDDEIVALGRSGYLAHTSPFKQHHYFGNWVYENRSRFIDTLKNGERIVGEWLAQAHGTRYDLSHEPFVAFDIMEKHKKNKPRRFIFDDFNSRIDDRFITPFVINRGDPFSIQQLIDFLKENGSAHGAIDPVEGAVWRIERKGKVDFLCKWVRPDKKDGCYLPEMSGGDAIWNWKPECEKNEK